MQVMGLDGCFVFNGLSGVDDYEIFVFGGIFNIFWGSEIIIGFGLVLGEDWLDLSFYCIINDGFVNFCDLICYDYDVNVEINFVLECGISQVEV